MCTVKGPNFVGGSVNFEVAESCLTLNVFRQVVEAKEDYPVPTPGKGELLLRLNCTGLCHSDVHVMLVSSWKTTTVGRSLTLARFQFNPFLWLVSLA